MNEKENPLLKLSGFAVCAGEVRLLQGIDLEMADGELVALTGPSGCGKTTLLRAVAGLIDPAEGEVLLHGMRPEEIGWPEFRRQVIYIEQNPVLLDLSVHANLARPFLYRVSKNGFPEERAKALLDRLGVGRGRLDQDARSLSVGQQQRVCVIRALLVEPKVLLFDEPTSALDGDAVESMECLIMDIAADVKVSALVVTHDSAQAGRLCKRVVDLEKYAVSGN